MTVNNPDGLSHINEKGVMIKRYFIVIMTFSFLACNQSSSENNAPEILALAASPPTVRPNEFCSLIVQAQDKDGDELKYVWDVQVGRISNPGATATWWAGDASPGQYTVTCLVSDGKAAVTKSITVTIQPDSQR